MTGPRGEIKTMDPHWMKMMIRPSKYGRSINWDWKDWTGFIVLIAVIVGLVRGESALAVLKVIGSTLTSILHH